MSDPVNTNQPVSNPAEAQPAEAPEASVQEVASEAAENATTSQEEVGMAAHVPEKKEEDTSEDSAMSDKEAQQEADKIENQIKKLKVKIDGKEEEVEEDELVRDFQKYKSANKRFQEAAKMKKESEQLVKALKEAPTQVLEKLGVDVAALAEDILLKQIELEKLSPEERKLREYEEEVERLRNEKKTMEEQKEQEEYARLRAQYEAEIEDQITNALDNSDLPKTPYTVKRMIHYMNKAVDFGHDDITPDEIIQFVQEDYENDMKALFGKYNADTLLKKLPPEVLDKIREAEVAKVKQVEDPLKTESQATGEPKEKPKKKIPKEAFRAWSEDGGVDPIEKYIEMYEKGELS